jgi:hypothetical protein
MQVALALGVEMGDDDDRQAGSRIAGLSKSDAVDGPRAASLCQARGC